MGSYANFTCVFYFAFPCTILANYPYVPNVPSAYVRFYTCPLFVRK